jgi:hypothetical protein
MPFEKGRSGNPSGRPQGARNKTTLAVEALLDGEAENLTRKAIELAKAGDGPSLRLCLDRLVPARKDRPVAFDMPRLETAGDALKASTAIVEATAEGELTPSEAEELSRVVANFARVAETAELARISHSIRRIGTPNQRKLFCDNDFRTIRGTPRCRQSVAQTGLILESLKAALWKRHLMPDW